MTGCAVKPLRKHRISQHGSAAAEFAIFAPLLIILVLGIADYGILMANIAALEGATRAIAEYARNSASCVAGGLSNGNCTTGISNFVATLKSNDTLISSATFSVPNDTLSTAGGNYCTCVDGNVVNCATGSCNVGGDARVIQYIQISATQNFSPAFEVTSFGYFPPTTFAFPSTITAQTTTRIQ